MIRRPALLNPQKKKPMSAISIPSPVKMFFIWIAGCFPIINCQTLWRQYKKIASGIEKKFKVQIEISPVQYLQSPKPTSPDAPVVRALREAIKTVYGIKAFAGGVGAGTLAAYFRQKNFPVAVWSKNNQTAHQPDEKCSIDNMIGNAKVFAHLFLRE